jgi:hypothetical protein
MPEVSLTLTLSPPMASDFSFRSSKPLTRLSGGVPQPIQAVAGTVLAQVVADRRGGSRSSVSSSLPITVVLGWDSVMKR